MIIAKDKIEENRQWLGKKSLEIKEQTKLSQVFGDPTRLKILLLLRRNKELCVTDLADILKISISAVSHQLRILEQSDLVTSLKMGRVVCYFFMKGNQNIVKLLNKKGIASQLS